MIRQLIREMILAEAAWTPEVLADDNYRIVVRNRYKTGQKIINLVDSASDGVLGHVTISKPNDYDGECAGAWVVNEAEVPESLSGAGPLLYDVAMEVAGADGLTADRSTVSPAARRVWDFYLNRRPDVTSLPLDDLFGTITPMDPYDDCRQSASYDKEDYDDDGNPPDIDWEPGDVTLKKKYRGPNARMSFRSSPLSRVYKKTGRPTIERLQSLGLIRFE